MATNGFTVTPTSGHSGVTTITVSATSLTSDAERGVWIDITAGTLTKSVLAFQDNAKHHLDVTPPRVYLPSTGGSATFHIDSDENWVLTNQTTWATFSQLSGSSTSVTVSAGINHSVDTRSAMFMINTPNITGSVYVEQPSAASLNVTPNPVYASSGASTTYMTITSNSGWTISTLPDWVTASQVSGTGNTTVVLYVTTNVAGRRTGTITLNYGDGSAYQIGIVQYGKYTLDVEPNPIMLPQSAGTTNFSVKTSGKWELVKPDFITNIVPSSGIGNTNVTIYHSASTSTTYVSDAITFHYGDDLSSLTGITVYQAPFVPSIVITPSEATVPRTGGTLSATVTSNMNLSVSGDSWLTATLSGNTLNVTANTNSGLYSRIGYVYVYSPVYGTQATLSVSQPGSTDVYFEITTTDQFTLPSDENVPDPLYFSKDGGEPTLYTDGYVFDSGTTRFFCDYVWDYGINEDKGIITDIHITSGITSIGSYTFYGCTGATITIDRNNTITSVGDGAFRDCYNLSEIVLPNVTTTIGGYAFYGCTGATSLTLSNSFTRIGRHAFENCSGLQEIVIPDTNSGATIGTSAFEGCNSVTSITIGNGVQFIESYAFICPSAVSLTIGNSVEQIGEGAFAGLKITEIVIPDSVRIIYEAAFQQCTDATALTLGSLVSYIGDNAFSYCGLRVIYDYLDSNPTLQDYNPFSNVPTGGTFYYTSGAYISGFQSKLPTWTFVQM